MEQRHLSEDDRMSDEEMREVVQLIANRQQEAERRAELPSVTEVSEALSVPPDRVQAALAEIRARKQVPPAMPPPPPPVPVFQNDVHLAGRNTFLGGYEEEIYVRRRRSSPASLVLALVGLVVFLFIAMTVFRVGAATIHHTPSGPLPFSEPQINDGNGWRDMTPAEKATIGKATQKGNSL